MTTDDLRKRARETAEDRLAENSVTPSGPFPDGYVHGFEQGALWHAAQQPTVDELATVLQQATDDGADRTEDYARAVVAHLTKGNENDE